MIERILGVVLVVCLLMPGAALTDEADRFVGHWYGSVATNTETVDAGLEIRRREDGTLTFFLALPMLNRYNLNGGDNATIEGDTISYAPFRMSLTLNTDALVGEIPRFGTMALRRVDAPVMDAPVPESQELPIAWEQRTSGRIYASPVVAGDALYVGTTAGVFFAMDINNGHENWRAAIGYPMLGDALVEGEGVYVVSDGGFLHKLNRTDGIEVWRYRLSDPAPRVMPHMTLGDWDWHSPQPVIADGVVYVGGADGSAHAVDAITGMARWTASAGDKIRAGAVVAGTRVVFANDAGELRAFARADGTPDWTFATDGKLENRPLFHQGHIIVGNRGSGVFAVDATSGEEVWRRRFWGSWVESAASAAGDTVYIGSSDLRRVTAMDADTGAIQWRSDVYGWAWGTPLVVGDRLYIGTAGAHPYRVRHLAAMVELDRTTGRILRRTPLPDQETWVWGVGGSPAQVGDRVIVATIAGTILAFDR